MSDESPHHPGPWRQHRERDWLILDADDGILPSITVATVHGNDADARLIAAAPELMALLEGGMPAP